MRSSFVAHWALFACALARICRTWHDCLIDEGVRHAYTYRAAIDFYKVSSKLVCGRDSRVDQGNLSGALVWCLLLLGAELFGMAGHFLRSSDLAEPRISEQSRAEKRQRWLTSIDLGVQFVTCLSNTDVLPRRFRNASLAWQS